jgi:hypothetical protein
LNAQFRQRFSAQVLNGLFFSLSFFFPAQCHSVVTRHALNVSRSFSLRATLATDLLVRNWGICGLAGDAQSVDSALIAMHARRWPFFLDPQAQANKWVRGMLEQMGLKVLREKGTPSHHLLH